MFLFVLCGLNYVGGYVRPGIVIDLKTSSGRGLLAGKTGAWQLAGKRCVFCTGLEPEGLRQDVNLFPLHVPPAFESDCQEEPGNFPGPTALSHAVSFMCRTSLTCGPW